VGGTLGNGELKGEIEISAYSALVSGRRIGGLIVGSRQQRAEDNRRQVIVVTRERGLGRAVAWVVGKEGDAVPLIRQNAASGSTLHAEEAGAWNILHVSYPMLRVNHSVDFKSEEGGCTNEAESSFSRLRRSEFGINSPD
jgi:ISXO2-like transposase domain